MYWWEVLKNIEGEFNGKSGEEIDVSGVCGDEAVEVVPVGGIEMRAESRQKIVA